jgi:hypothetical protein
VTKVMNILYCRFSRHCIRIMVLRSVTPCRLIRRYPRFGGICCLHAARCSWNQLVLPKRWHLYTKLHGVRSQYTVIRRKCTFVFRNKHGISSLVKRLSASQEGLFSIKLGFLVGRITLHRKVACFLLDCPVFITIK